MRFVTRPQFVLPLLAGLALLIALFTIADIGEVWAAFQRLRAVTLVVVTLWFLGYAVLKYAAWQYLMTQAGYTGKRGTTWIGFMTGEVLSGIPGSPLAGCYVISVRSEFSMARASGAATMMFFYEVTAALLLVGLAGAPALPVAQLVFLVLGLGALAVGVAGNRLGRLIQRRHIPRILRRWQNGILELLAGVQATGNWRIAIIGTTFAAGYLLLASGGLWSLLDDLTTTPDGGLLSPFVAIAGYGLAIVVSLLSPVPFDIGMTEAGGITGLAAWGYPAAAALTAMLCHRVLRVLTTWGLMLLTILYSAEDLGGLLRSPRSTGEPTNDQAPGAPG